MAHTYVLEQESSLNEKYQVARKYFDANEAVKAGEKVKKDLRLKVIQLWGTGDNELADLKVMFSSGNKEVQDTEALEAFLAVHGKSLADFRKFQLSERLEVKKVA